MKRKIIAVERWGTRLTVEDYDERWTELWKVAHEETEKRALEFHTSGVVSRYKHHAAAKPVLARLKKKYGLVIVTSRRRLIEKETRDWLAQHFQNLFDDIHFAGMWDAPGRHRYRITKAEVIRQVGADYLIDDQPKHCVAAAEAGIQALLFGHYPWNKVRKLPANVTRVKDWSAVGEYFGV